MRQLATVLSFATFAVALAAQDPPMKNAPELGTVPWHRDLAAATTAARASARPLFLLFQEIPGCSTCTSFGKDVLSHPLLAPAIEACFVPVAVRNNVDGDEGAIRDRFGEPPWNNPVVRFLDGDGKDLLPRADGVWDAHGIAARMITALERSKRPVPGYLRLAHAESDPKTATAVFAMHCFWEGEAALGEVDGVVRTTAAFAGGEEVVEVVFRPAVVALAELTAHAAKASCRPMNVAAPRGAVKPAPASDQQHALGGTPFAKLALTPMQRTRVHAALTAGRDPGEWLTPAQAATVRAATGATTNSK
ncbi:MAG: VPGUxxT family thioredoxin-like (seleno)protein, type 2 [Planctomycetota bacterium]